MNNIVYIALIINIISNIIKSIRYKQVASLILLGSITIIVLTVVGKESGKIILSLIPVSIAVIFLLFSDGKLFKSKFNIIGAVMLLIFYMFFIGTFVFSPAATSNYAIWKLRQISILAILPSILLFMRGKISDKEIEIIENCILVSAVVISMYVVISFLLNGIGTLNASWFIRQTVGSINANWLSRFLGFALIIVNSNKFSKKTSLAIGLNSLLLIAALLTGSKTILFFVLPVILLLKFGESSNKRVFLKNILIFFFLILVLYFFFSLFNQMALTRRFSLSEGTAVQRMNMYKLSFNSYLQSNNFELIFGNGAGTIGRSLGYGYTRQYPHNIIIEILYEMGFVGLILFLIMPIYVIISYRKSYKGWIFHSYILFYLYSLTSGDLASNEWVFILFSLCLVYLNGRLRNSSKKNIRFSIEKEGVK